MDLSCIISSGDLELYVLGMLPQEEAYKIEQLALLFVEVEAEIHRIKQTLHEFSEEAEVVPEPHVRENFIKAIKELKSNEETSVAVADQVILHKEEREPVHVISMQQHKGNRQWLLAASFIGLIISIGSAVYLYNRANQYQQQLSSVESRLNNVEQTRHEQQQQIAAYNKTMQMMHDAVYKKIAYVKRP